MSEVPSNLFTNFVPEQLACIEGSPDIHATNGTYMHPAKAIVPKMLAAFQFVADFVAKPDDIFVVAVNSDISMRGIMNAKNAGAAEIATLQSETRRALKVLIPLALQHPNRIIVSMFYDEDTPQRLCDAVHSARVALGSLHKWDYGTEPNASKHIGVYRFNNTYSFPSPADSNPVSFYLPPHEDQSGIVKVERLTEEFGKHGAPYMNMAGQLLFPARHDSLKGYTAEFA